MSVTVTSPSELRGFDARARSLIADAMALGWTGRLSSKGHWIGRAPDGTATMSAPRKMDDRGRTGRNAVAAFTRWVKAQRPDVAAKVEAAVDAYVDNDPIASAVISDGIRKRDLAPKPEPESLPLTPLAAATLTRTVVSSGPWSAHRNPSSRGGTKYPSRAVVERHWSDGTVDYACAYEGCDYASEVARSVASHYGAAHRDAPAGPPVGLVPAEDYTEPITERTYQPTDRLVDALVAYLSGLDLDVATPMSLALSFLTWAHERPDLEHSTRPGGRELTDAEILDRIRGLVGQPQRQEIEALRAELEQARAERDAAIDQKARYERDLDALRDLVAGLGR